LTSVQEQVGQATFRTEALSKDGLDLQFAIPVKPDNSSGVELDLTSSLACYDFISRSKRKVQVGHFGAALTFSQHDSIFAIIFGFRVYHMPKIYVCIPRINVSVLGIAPHANKNEQNED
jgi:hypothetical protein